MRLYFHEKSGVLASRKWVYGAFDVEYLDRKGREKIIYKENTE